MALHIPIVIMSKDNDQLPLLSSFFSDFKFHACSVNLFSSGIRSDE